MQIPELEELDIRILGIIKDNARMSYSEIGSRVGLSRVAVKNHIENMEKRGIIKGYKTVIVKPESAEKIIFFLDVITEAEQYTSILEQLKQYPMLKQVYTTTGESRIHCVGVASNSNKMHIFVTNLYRNTKGVNHLEFHAALSTEKDLFGSIEFE